MLFIKNLRMMNETKHSNEKSLKKKEKSKNKLINNKYIPLRL